MKKMLNKVVLAGYLYDHNLQEKITGENSQNPGTKYIAGTIDIATDNNITNIVSVHYSFVTPKFASGKDNSTYPILMDILKGVHKTYLKASEDGGEATKIRVDTSLNLNEFYTKREGETEVTFVSSKRNEGGFIRILKEIPEKEEARNFINADMVITGVRHVEGDEEKKTKDKTIIKGCLFGHRNVMLPMEFSVTNPQGMDYFEGLEVSSKSPVFTHVKGRQISETITRTIVEEGAFGDEVREVTNSRRDMVIYWAAPEPYAWDDEDTILASELKQAIADYEVHKAELKANYDAYQSQKNNGVQATANDDDPFNF